MRFYCLRTGKLWQTRHAQKPKKINGNATIAIHRIRANLPPRRSLLNNHARSNRKGIENTAAAKLPVEAVPDHCQNRVQRGECNNSITTGLRAILASICRSISATVGAKKCMTISSNVIECDSRSYWCMPSFLPKRWAHDKVHQAEGRDNHIDIGGCLIAATPDAIPMAAA
jgi:hypothetical protein